MAGLEEDMFYMYSIREDKWTTIPGCQHRYKHSCILVDDCLYVIGGERRLRRGGYGKIKAPIESYDLVLGEAQEHGICSTQKELATYVESFRDIVIIGTLSERYGVHAFGFNVDTKTLSKYRVAGRSPWSFPDGASIVECNGRVYFMFCSSSYQHRMFMFMLTIGFAQTAVWAELSLTGHTITPRQANALVVVDGLLLCFGGKHRYRNEDLPTCFIHPETGEVIKVGDETSIQENGELPRSSSGVLGVSTANKAWFYAANYVLRCAQAEFYRD